MAERLLLSKRRRTTPASIQCAFCAYLRQNDRTVQLPVSLVLPLDHLLGPPDALQPLPRPLQLDLLDFHILLLLLLSADGLNHGAELVDVALKFRSHAT